MTGCSVGAKAHWIWCVKQTACSLYSVAGWISWISRLSDFTDVLTLFSLSKVSIQSSPPLVLTSEGRAQATENTYNFVTICSTVTLLQILWTFTYLEKNRYYIEYNIIYNRKIDFSMTSLMTYFFSVTKGALAANYYLTHCSGRRRIQRNRRGCTFLSIRRSIFIKWRVKRTLIKEQRNAIWRKFTLFAFGNFTHVPFNKACR